MDLKEIGVNTRNWVDSAQDMDYCLRIRRHQPTNLEVTTSMLQKTEKFGGQELKGKSYYSDESNCSTSVLILLPNQL
jgi:hypothetical protein